MPYVPNASQLTEPVASQTVESAAQEFRVLKTAVAVLSSSIGVDNARDLRVTDTAVTPIPVVADRAGKVLGFDAAGNPVVVIISGALDPSLRLDLATQGGDKLIGADIIGNGVTDKSAAIVAANSLGFPLRFSGISVVGTPTTITVPIIDTMAQIFSVGSLITIDNGLPVRPEWFGMAQGNIDLAITALPATGGVVQLENKTYPPQGYVYGFGGAGKYISKPNVTLLGRKMPTLSYDCKKLEGGTVIQGMVLVFATNFEMRNLGVDSGFTAVNTYLGGVATPGIAEGLLLTYPNDASKAASQQALKARLHNVIGLCFSPSTPVHAVIVGEGYSDVTCTGEVVGCFGIHGIVIKCSEVKADQLTAYGNSGEGVVIKSDAQTTSVAQNIQIGKIATFAGGPLKWGPYAVAAGGFGTLIHAASNNVSVVQIGSIFDSGHQYGFGLSIASGFSIDNLQIGMITTDSNSLTSVSLNVPAGALLFRSGIGQVVARNTPAGVQADFTPVTKFTIGSLKVVNAQVAMSCAGVAGVDVGEIIAENCTSGAIRMSTFAKSLIGSITLLGTTPVNYATDLGGNVPVLQNGWTVVVDGESFGVVHTGRGISLKGLIKPGTTNQFAALPGFAQPKAAKRFMVLGYNGTTVSAVPVTIGTNGLLYVNEIAGGFANCTSWLSMSGISYPLTE